MLFHTLGILHPWQGEIIFAQHICIFLVVYKYNNSIFTKYINILLVDTRYISYLQTNVTLEQCWSTCQHLFSLSLWPYWFLTLISAFSFIENYGTHIVTSATIGGRDVVYIRQHQSSPLSALDIENYVKDIGDHRFSSDSKGQSTAGPLKYKDKVSVRWLYFFFFHKL